ncbi:E3 ubiquitin-protein ligase rnf220 [Plakobranchus ocellatus]|uniref:E3 ubiquitin-protein ligase rnf220 n=1 Tax=Plakobranchus ocellatus TaxID=259542 RepID=A0AAV3ZRX5_9GAST|nr:E3 ubiquitin-protein ligase rnf220 [Plakobranchus ocellatus]
MSTDLQRSLAMFRFNFWAKPFFTPAPGNGGMENTPFVPNPLTSPALMVLASTAAAEGHEVQRRQGQSPHSQHHPSFPGRGMDKELPPPPPPPPFSTAAFMYRPGDPFSSPLYSPLSFVRPELDRRLALMNPAMRSGAFRPLGPTGAGGDGEVPQNYHSAFSPASATSSSAKKLKPEEANNGNNSGALGGGTAAASSSSDHHHHQHGAQFTDHQHHHHEESPSYHEEHIDRRECSSPQQGSIKEERPSSLCSSQGYETVSEPMSDSGDAYERGTPDSEGRSLRRNDHFTACICVGCLQTTIRAMVLSKEPLKSTLTAASLYLSERGAYPQSSH